MWLLILVTSYYPLLPSSRSVQEFTSESSCKIALVEAKKAYTTVNSDSYCISLSGFEKREQIKAEVKRLETELERLERELDKYD